MEYMIGSGRQEGMGLMRRGFIGLSIFDFSAFSVARVQLCFYSVMHTEARSERTHFRAAYNIRAGGRRIQGQSLVPKGAPIFEPQIDADR